MTLHVKPVDRDFARLLQDRVVTKCGPVWGRLGKKRQGIKTTSITRKRKIERMEKWYSEE